MNAILLWLWRKFTAFVETKLNPESAARAKALEERAAAQEQRAKEAERLALESEAAYQASTARRVEWDRLTAESRRQEDDSQQRLLVSQDRVKAIEDENKKAHEIIDRQSDADSVRADV